MSYRVWVLSMVSTTQSLPLAISIALSQVRGSVMAVTNTVGFWNLISLRVGLAFLVSLLPLVCITCLWRLYTSTLSWSTTIMRPTPLVDKNMRRVGPMPPTLTTRTDDDRSLRWPNMPNPSENRTWQEYREIWLVRSRSLLCHHHSHRPPFKIEVNDGSIGAAPSSNPSTPLMTTSPLGSILYPSS